MPNIFGQNRPSHLHLLVTVPVLYWVLAQHGQQLFAGVVVHRLSCCCCCCSDDVVVQHWPVSVHILLCCWWWCCTSSVHLLVVVLLLMCCDTILFVIGYTVKIWLLQLLLGVPLPLHERLFLSTCLQAILNQQMTWQILSWWYPSQVYAQLKHQTLKKFEMSKYPVILVWSWSGLVWRESGPGMLLVWTRKWTRWEQSHSLHNLLHTFYNL